MTLDQTAAAVVRPPSTLPYALLASESTVQVLSPTVVNDVIYCTIETLGHHVIASFPIPRGSLENVSTSVYLTAFAEGIEEVMNLPNVIAGRGAQSIDGNGLLQDNLIFTVEYVPPDSTGTSITAEAEVPVDAVRGPYTAPGHPGIDAAKAEIDLVYAGLQAAAGG